MPMPNQLVVRYRVRDRTMVRVLEGKCTVMRGWLIGVHHAVRDWKWS
jgi:hypothetical protein